MSIPVLGACAGNPTATPVPQAPGAATTPDRAPPTAARIYTVGEEHFARGEYAQAVDLWRNAIVELAPIEQTDHLRHALILRIGYGQLMAWSQSGDTSQLNNAKQMLERYAERHTALFGETDKARAERGDVYELLYEVEQALAPPEPEPDTIADASDSPTPTDTLDEEYVDGGEFQRTVVVDTRNRPTVDDPAMRAKLSSTFTDPFYLGGVLTGPTIVLMHGPRALLRASGFARPAGKTDNTAHSRREARKLGRSLLATARPALKQCYEAAYARHPIGVAQSTVEVQIDAQGQVTAAKVVAGGVVDTLGDLCVVGELESTHVAVAEEAIDSTTSIHVPLTFFYEGPILFNEGSGRSAPPENMHQIDATPGVQKRRRGPDGSAAPGRSMGA